MKPLSLREISGKSSLLTRAAADAIIARVREHADGANGQFAMDLSGVIAVSPSFVDQLVGGLVRFASERGQGRVRIRMRAMPTRASSKFAAVARSYGLVLMERAAGDWYMEEPAS